MQQNKGEKKIKVIKFNSTKNLEVLFIVKTAEKQIIQNQQSQLQHKLCDCKKSGINLASFIEILLILLLVINKQEFQRCIDIKKHRISTT